MASIYNNVYNVHYLHYDTIHVTYVHNEISNEHIFHYSDDVLGLKYELHNNDEFIHEFSLLVI